MLECVRSASGRFSERKLDLTPTQNLGHFMGLVLGDGYISKGRGGYHVSLETSKQDIIKIFQECVQKFGLKVFLGYRVKKRRFPNSRVYASKLIRATVSSKCLYGIIKPNKLPDHKWRIPPILSTNESLVGFLQGIYDAEGWVNFTTKPRGVLIGIGSKHRSNLIQIYQLLASFGIEAKMFFNRHTRIPILVIRKQKDILEFRRLIGFRLPHKQKRLEAIWF